MKPANESNNPGSKGLTESQYLAEQARQAKEAISASLSSAVSHTAHGADPRLWAKTFPKSTVIATAVAAFTAAVVAVPSKEEQALKRLMALERLVSGNAKKPEPQNGAHATEGEHPAEKNGWIWTIAKEVFNAVKPMLLSIVTGYISNQHHDGQEPAPADRPQPHESRI